MARERRRGEVGLPGAQVLVDARGILDGLEGHARAADTILAACGAGEEAGGELRGDQDLVRIDKAIEDGDLYDNPGPAIGIFRFELAYQLRRPWPWLMSGVLLLVCFLMTRDAAVGDALYDEFFVNSPFSIAVSTVNT